MSYTRASAAQMRAAADYVRTLADLLHLKDWRIVVSNEPPPEDPPALAAVKVTPGRKYAIVRFASDWYESAPEELRHTVTHELIHCHIAGMDQAVEGLLDTLGTGVYNIFASAFNTAMEYATDGLADAVAGFLPLPDIPPEPERVIDVVGSLTEEAAEAEAGDTTTEAASGQPRPAQRNGGALWKG